MASASFCCPTVGQAAHMEWVASAAQGLSNPRDVEFNPTQPGVLWVANNDTDSLTLLNTSAGGGSNSAVRNSAMPLEDRAPFHYMERISSLAFESSGYFATCNEARNTYDDTQLPPNDFMGPTLYKSDFSALVNSRAQPCSVDDDATTCYFTHYDMLHEAPVCLGIAHDTETATPFGHVYWVYDGMEKMLVRFDFEEPHGPGSLDHSRASIRRFEDVQLTPVLGVPSHMMMDPVARVLYVADTGSGRVLRINPDSGSFVRNARHNFSIYSSMAETFEYSMYSCTQQQVFASGIHRPSGLHVDEHFVYVGEHGSGKILIYEKQSGSLVSSVVTGATGLLGLAKSPFTNELWFADGPGNRIGTVVVDTPCGYVFNHNLNSPSAASAVDWGGSGASCDVTPYEDTEADRERFHHEAFLNTHNASNFPSNYPASYGDMDQEQCALVNFDILLMEGFICHLCLPEPCANGGQCVHHDGVYTMGGFSCQCPLGFTGDICQTPMPVSSVVAQVSLGLDLASYSTPAALESLRAAIRADLATHAGVPLSQVTIEALGAGSVWVRFRITAAAAAASGAATATSPMASLRSLQTKLESGGVQIGGGAPIGSVVTLDLQVLDPSSNGGEVAYPPPSAYGAAEEDEAQLSRPAVIVAVAVGMLVAGVGCGFVITRGSADDSSSAIAKSQGGGKERASTWRRDDVEADGHDKTKAAAAAPGRPSAGGSEARVSKLASMELARLTKAARQSQGQASGQQQRRQQQQQQQQPGAGKRAQQQQQQWRRQMA